MDHRVIVERNGSLVISFVSLDFFFFFFFSFNDFASRIHREPNKRNSFETRNDSPISNTSHFESHAAASWPTLITTSLSFLPRIITRHSFIFLFFFFFFILVKRRLITLWLSSLFRRGCRKETIEYFFIYPTTACFVYYTNLNINVRLLPSVLINRIDHYQPSNNMHINCDSLIKFQSCYAPMRTNSQKFPNYFTRERWTRSSVIRSRKSRRGII